MNNINQPPSPEGSTLILVEKVLKLNSILESLNLIPSSRCSGFVYKIEKDSDVMLIELIKNNDCPNNEEMEGDDDVLDEEEFGGDHFNKFPTRSELASLNEDEGWNRIDEFVQYQDDLWDESTPPMNVSFISKLTLNSRLKRAHQQLSYLTSATKGKTLKNPYLICDICGGAHEADECDQVISREQGFGEMLHKQRNDMHEQFSQILSTLESRIHTSHLKKLTLAITTRSGTTTRDPPYLSAPAPSVTHKMTEVERPEGEETLANSGGVTSQSPTLYHPSKSSDIPFPS
ncbi:hypothetical protein Tco_1160490 [Tanacetum coccineum]